MLKKHLKLLRIFFSSFLHFTSRVFLRENVFADKPCPLFSHKRKHIQRYHESSLWSLIRFSNGYNFPSFIFLPSFLPSQERENLFFTIFHEKWDKLLRTENCPPEQQTYLWKFVKLFFLYLLSSTAAALNHFRRSWLSWACF